MLSPEERDELGDKDRETGLLLPTSNRDRFIRLKTEGFFSSTSLDDDDEEQEDVVEERLRRLG